MTKILGDLFINFENNTIKDETEHHTLVSNTGFVSSSDSMQGNSSIYSDAITNKFIISNSTAFDFGTNNFTIDFWIKLTGSSGIWTGIFSLREGTLVSDFNIAIHNSSKSIYFEARHEGNSICRFYTNNDVVVINEWAHIALVRYGTDLNNIKLFVNGNSLPLNMTTNLAANATFHDFSVDMVFGECTAIGGLIGHLDAFRIVNGEALWIENFSVTEKALMYEDLITVPISTIYNISHYGNLRGKAKQGWIRPTVKQFFTSNNFEEIEAGVYPAYDNLIGNLYVYFTGYSSDSLVAHEGPIYNVPSGFIYERIYWPNGHNLVGSSISVDEYTISGGGWSSYRYDNQIIGKKYYEVTLIGVGSYSEIGVVSSLFGYTGVGYVHDSPYGWLYDRMGRYMNNNIISYTPDAFGVGNVIGMAVDASKGKVWWSKNGVWQVDTNNNIPNL